MFHRDRADFQSVVGQGASPVRNVNIRHHQLYALFRQDKKVYTSGFQHLNPGELQIIKVDRMVNMVVEIAVVGPDIK